VWPLVTMSKGALFAAAAVLACANVAITQASRYVCDTVMIEDVDATMYDLDYDQRKQQKEIDAFTLLLDQQLANSDSNSSCGAAIYHNVDASFQSVLQGGCQNDVYKGAECVFFL
jgi:hypothetical protein